MNMRHHSQLPDDAGLALTASLEKTVNKEVNVMPRGEQKAGYWILVGLVTAGLCACVTSGKYKPVSDLATLEVAFADAAWNGKTVPKGQQCRRFGGNGATPALAVGNLPAEANAIILEFSDRDVPKMDNGGHGKIGYRIPSGAGKVVIPSVPGHTFDH